MPHLKNGYTKIANELIDQFCKYRLSGEEWKVLWVIIRKTYGFNKKMDMISLSQFSQATGITRQNAKRALKSLYSKKIIAVLKKEYRSVVSYGIQKSYKEWKPVLKKEYSTQKRVQPVLNIDTLVYSKLSPTKETITKETIKERYVIFQKIWDQYPKKIGRKEALGYFNSTVKTNEDYKRIEIAIQNYLHSERVMRGFVLNGANWFDQWEDWVNFKEDVCQKCKGKGKFISNTGYEITCDCPAGKRK